MTVIDSTPAEPRTRSKRGVSPRIVFLALGGLCLLAGLDAALLLIGVWAPVTTSRLPMVHGMVMALGFMGTVVALERAQSLGRWWGYLAPAVLGAGGISLVVGLPAALGQLLLVDGCLLFLALYLALWRRTPVPLVAVQVVSVVPALAAAALWLVVDVSALICLLVAFIVLTITAERAELARLALGQRAVPVLVALAAVITLAAFASLVWPVAAGRVFGGVLIVTAAWLVRDDIPRRMIRRPGLLRYTSAALLAGYWWLAVAGVTWLVVGQPATQGTYDIVIHAALLGFGVSMIMAHAPIVFPAVLGRPLPYGPAMWGPLGLLHAGLLARIAGDLTQWTTVWQVGSVATVVALLAFVVVSAVAVVRAP